MSQIPPAISVKPTGQQQDAEQVIQDPLIVNNSNKMSSAMRMRMSRRGASPFATRGVSDPFANSSAAPTRAQLKDRTQNYRNGGSNNFTNNHHNRYHYNHHNNNNNLQNPRNSKSNFNYQQLSPNSPNSNGNRSPHGNCNNLNVNGGYHSEAFPERYTYSGELNVRTDVKRKYKKRYFVLSNNFLLCGMNRFCKKLERVTPLEGARITKRGYLRKSDSKEDDNDNENKKDNSDDASRVFALRLRGNKTLYFQAKSQKDCENWCNYIERASSLKIKDIYRFLYTLGRSETQMTKVVSAKHNVTGEDCAIKIVDKRSCDTKMLQSEIKILKQLDSDYIVQLYDLFETTKFVYIVMEKLS